MFGLMPLAITIILVGVIYIGMVFFAGDIFSESSKNGKVLKYDNEATQIVNAIKMYTFKERQKPAGADVITNVVNDPFYYRGGKSSVGDWVLADSSFTDSQGVMAGVESEALCKAINENIGYQDPVPSCASVPAALSESSEYYCCTN